MMCRMTDTPDPAAAGQWVRVEFAGLVPPGQVVADADPLEVGGTLMRAFGFTHIDGLTLAVTHVAGQRSGPSIEPGRVLVVAPPRGDQPMPLCAFYSTPTAEERAELGLPDDTDVVLGCDAPQGEGPLFFYLPAEGGSVRVPVCVHHADHLSTHHGPGR